MRTMRAGDRNPPPWCMLARSNEFTHTAVAQIPSPGSTPLDSMAVSSGDDIPAQLAALLGNKSVRIRKTDETPPRVTVVDVISAISGRSANQAAEQLRRLIERYPDVKANCFDVKFPDACGRKWQNGTATSDATGIVRIRQPAAEHQEH